MSKAWKGTEARIAKMLSIWWTGHEKAFTRAPCSGGWPAPRANGDMVANIDLQGIPQHVKDAARAFTSTWSMDVKRRIRGSRSASKDGDPQKWNVEELLTAPKHPIIKWWLEMNALAATRGTYRFLVANKATYHSYVIFGEREMTYIKSCVQTAASVIQSERFDWSSILGPSITVVGVSSQVQEALTIFELRSFLSKVNSRDLGGLGNGPRPEGAGAKTAP
jgi:hypothetical protein